MNRNNGVEENGSGPVRLREQLMLLPPGFIGEVCEGNRPDDPNEDIDPIGKRKRGRRNDGCRGIEHKFRHGVSRMDCEADVSARKPLIPGFKVDEPPVNMPVL